MSLYLILNEAYWSQFTLRQKAALANQDLSYLHGCHICACNVCCFYCCSIVKQSVSQCAVSAYDEYIYLYITLPL